ncbi:MAG: hypothetical protein JW783_06025 [Bacteroidales bacterium]|nr:hypothetical protein [Bacteroidales bacterium]MBN2750273.1 hypothetical protein [Bacteroidales bacterium]
MKRSNILFFVGVLLILAPVSVFAQDFEVAPVNLEFSAEPGENQVKTINVRNHSNQKTSFMVVLSDYLPKGDGGREFLPPNSTKRSCANWMNINPSFFELNPGEEMALQVGMLVPGEEFGAAWAMLFIQPTREQTSWSAEGTLGAGVMVSGRIGVTVSQTPKSNSTNSVKVTSFAEDVTASTGGDRLFNLSLDNLGERITKCKVFLIASNMMTAEEKQFPPIEVETFPKATRNVQLTLPVGQLPAGKYALAAIVDYGPKYALEGAQIVIDVKESGVVPTPDEASPLTE